MKISALKQFLERQATATFRLPDGVPVPAHFHVTEVGEVSRHFIDCGGTVRHEKVANLQLWSASDYDHRLAPQKLAHIIGLAENRLGLGDLEVEVEYQGQYTIEKFGLQAVGNELHLVGQHTNCLAADRCGVPAQKTKISLAELTGSAAGCQPGSGCC